MNLVSKLIGRKSELLVGWIVLYLYLNIWKSIMFRLILSLLILELFCCRATLPSLSSVENVSLEWSSYTISAIIQQSMMKLLLSDSMAWSDRTVKLYSRLVRRMAKMDFSHESYAVLEIFYRTVFRELDRIGSFPNNHSWTVWILDINSPRM
jgi:hypothetical protein